MHWTWNPLQCAPSNYIQQSKEVKTISTDRMRTLYESMTKNRAALELLSIGVVRGISTVVRPPCEDPTPF
jgi:hypothetical protein